MNESMIDVILFAVIAVFLVLKLGSVLGKKTGHQDRIELFKDPEKRDESSAKDEGNVVPLHNEEHPMFQEEKPQETYADTPLAQSIEEIRKLDGSFHPDQFLDGACKAFEWILQAYVEGNGKVLKSLLSPDVYDNFANDIRSREKSGLHIEDTLVGIDDADILEIKMDGSTANITVKIVSDQVNALVDADGNAVEGDPAKVVTVTDIWTFAKDMKSRDPNWLLVETRSPN